MATRQATASEVDYLVVGHLSVDTVDDTRRPGGSVLYAAATAAALDGTVGVVSVAGDEFDWPAMLPDGVRSRVRWHIRPCDRSTGFVNVYAADGRRRQHLTHRAPAVVRSDIPEAWRRPRVAHVAPVADEVPDDVLDRVGASFVGITGQGWLRRLAVDQPVIPGPWSPPGDRLLGHANAVVVSEEDLRGEPRGTQAVAETFAAARERARDPSRGRPVSSGSWEPRHAARAPDQLVVVTRGAGGAVAYLGDAEMTQPAIHAREVDLTGAGDTFATALFVRLAEGIDVGLAMEFAAAAASLGIEAPGPGGVASRAAVRRRMKGGDAEHGE